MSDINLLAREAVEAAIGTALTLKLSKIKEGKLFAAEILNLFEIPKTTGVEQLWMIILR